MTTATPHLKAATRSTRCEDPTEEQWIDLIIAIFDQAKKDLSHPVYRRRAQQWLRSPGAQFYAGLLGVEDGRIARRAQ